MAAAATAAVLLLLFTFSSAHYSSDQPKNDFFSTDPSLVTLPDSEPKPGAAILLPSERPESEPATIAEIEPAEVKSTNSPTDVVEQKEEKSESEKTDSLPLTTVVTLRPINRHFSRGSFFSIRRGHKCHSRLRHHNSHFHQLRQRFGGQREISFGNDMIAAKDQDRGFDPAHSGDGRSLERWARYNHGGHRLSLTNDETIREEINGMAAHPQIYHQHRHHHHRRQHDDDEGEEEEHGNGIIKGLMRFLNL